MLFYIFLVLCVPVLFSLHQICIREGSDELDVFSGTFITILAPTLIFGILTMFISDIHFNLEFLILMVVSGVLNFLIARTAFYSAIYRIGVNLTAPLSATRIYFAVLLGFLIGENVTAKLIIMTLSIFLGISFLSKPSNVKTDLVGISLAILAGLFSALSSFFVRIGMTMYPAPILGTAISYLSSTILYPILFKNKIKIKKLNLGKIKYFTIGGILVGVGHYLRYYSLIHLPISLVEPLISIHPMFTILLSYLLIKDREIFSKRVLIGSFLVIFGIEIYFYPL